MHTKQYDAIIIGAGQTGNPLAREMAKAGRRTALIEREHVGGTCINRGCTPTKTLIASAQVAHLARRATDFGVRAESVSVDMAAVHRRMKGLVTEFREGLRNELCAIENLDMIFGEARFSGPKEVSVRLPDRDELLSLSADKIILNVGGRPAVPPVEGLRSVPFLDSTTILELEEVPEHLLVLGGGYIGLEYAQMFRRFGSRVTIIEATPFLLAHEDTDVSEEMARILCAEGIELRLATKVVHAAETAGSGGIVLTTEAENSEQQAAPLHGSHLLVAVGRKPNTDTLGLEKTGVTVDDKGFIVVNERMETAVPGIWAAGEAAGSPAFTHIAYDDFRILCANLLENGSRTTKNRLVPQTMFTDPQVGRVGLSEREAREKKRNVRVAKLPMTEVARTLETGETRGFIKALVDADTDALLGCAMFCREGGELMAVVMMAMLGNLPYTALRDGIFAHPTLAEALNNLFLTLDRKES